MKKNLVYLLLLLPFFALGQQTFHSWDGTGLSPHKKVRALNFFVNIIYDVNPQKNVVQGTEYWSRYTSPAQAGINVPGTIPTYLLDFIDLEYKPNALHGCITRLYGESSFHELQITGEFVVVNVLESRVLSSYKTFNYGNVGRTCIDMINESGGLQTLYGHNSIRDFSENGDGIEFYQMLFRNISDAYGGIKINNGLYSNFLNDKKIIVEGKEYPMGPVGTAQGVGSDDITQNPTTIVTHEIAHSLFGGNNFHTSGGNHRRSSETMAFMTIQGGFGLMGAANSGLVSCNGYERWRMHWRNPEIPASNDSYICARDVTNSIYLNADITKEDGDRSFILRDFVTYGDAIRIKLPYKDDDTIPNQYIWLEFHDVGNNNKLDFLQYSNNTCLYRGKPGIYAYYQIGRDVLESTNKSDVWDYQNRDNLRIISNEGYWDYTEYAMASDTNFVCTQWNWDKYYYVPEYENPFGGYQDQERFIVPKDYDTDLANTKDSVFQNGNFVQMKPVLREKTIFNKKSGHKMVQNNIPFLGDAQDAFSYHRKITMATNPSTCNTKTCYSSSNSAIDRLTFVNKKFNEQTTYLSGLSIEMEPYEKGSGWLVKIRWDDYEITENARWTGTIVLQEQVNLLSGKTILLAQNRTPAQRYRDKESGYFSPVTTLTCKSGSRYEQAAKSTLHLTEKSGVRFENGSKSVFGDNARIKLQGGSSLVFEPGAEWQCGKKVTLTIGSGCTCIVPNQEQFLQQFHVVVRPGGKIREN